MSTANELYHYGRKGMKWGQHIYAEPDGTLTKRGQARSERELRGMNSKKRKDYEPDPGKWVKDDLTRARKVTNESSSMVNQLKNANERAMKNSPRKKMDLSNMSDQELRDQINRAMLERQYNEIFSPREVSRGRMQADKVLGAAGNVLTVAGSALSIALAIRELTG